MIKSPVGIRSLAIRFPRLIRTNDYWQTTYQNQGKLKRNRNSRSTHDYTNDNSGLTIWSQAVTPYLPDPFRGSVERRVLSADESSLMLECQAAQDVLSAANLKAEDIELVIVASIFPEGIGFGNAAYIARKLNLHCPAWNLESTCSSALIALQNASALVQTGEYQNVLVVVSHLGSNAVDKEDSLSWSMGDAAGAFLVDSLHPNQGILGSKIVHTAATCEAYSHELELDRQGKPRMRTRTGENPSVLAETAVEFVRICCKGAIASAGVTLDQIDFFAFNTPTAWYASVCTQALGIDPERTLNLYPRYANIGPVFPLAALYHAAQSGKLRENDLVLAYTNGAAATAAATVMRWGDVALGSVPAPPISVTPAQEKIHVPAGKATPKETLSREQLLAAQPKEQQEILETYLLNVLASLLQHPSSNLTPEQSLTSFLDSLIVLMLKSRIETDLQVRVSIEQFFGESTITQLAKHLLNQFALANLMASGLGSVTDVSEAEDREKLSL
ncbi:3-oxoacyl-[acyl-carrier-protein] synthase III C-terminal domain-containing protein [Coleofasciculus sp.]|uniref:3-oxoacyl-[acyl-carrier-protein] synthase III C-terminal domain-containing protein n=1 Tax=Coleofasciculus sp. TaxID=3100458 RepID=UPI0039F9E90B